MIIDGTDLSEYEFPEGFNFIILEQVIEHVENWEEVLKRAEEKAGGLIVATPNGAVVEHEDKHELHDQMAHVVWLTPEQFEEKDYLVTRYSLTGKVNDTIVASKVCNTVLEDPDGVHESREAASKS
jgi:hypothetical protein